jgi:hypothetical protein
MSRVAIPSWNSHGVLPPNDLGNPTSRKRSPYTVSSMDFVSRFGTTPERLSILEGFLSFRLELYGTNLIRGFQWVDGSFCEDIESLESRPPKDIDVVTFFCLPNNYTQETFLKAYSQLFNHDFNKNNYHVDAYFVDLNGGASEFLINNSAYWYSLWSHRRDARWKGYLRIDLSQVDDHAARENLNQMMAGESMQ